MIKEFRMAFVVMAAVLLGALASSQVLGQQADLEVPVSSTSFIFSPGNWDGDHGRGGSVYRQSWNPGAYFRVYWSSTTTSPSASMHFDISELGETASNPPQITYNIDGIWTKDVPVAEDVSVDGLSGTGSHCLTVYIDNSQQIDRWGSPGLNGTNVVRVTGLSLDPGSTPTVVQEKRKWALEIGDSITEGIFAADGNNDSLADYSYFDGEALQTLGYEYGVSACGYSGWLRPGCADKDVPGYYIVSGSTNGAGGTYDASASRWDKIDAHTSLLDSAGYISGYGGLNQQPSIIMINYGTNDALNQTDPSDTLASIAQSINALRRAAPNAKIFLIVPFGQFDANLIYAGVKNYKAAHSRDSNIFIIDLGADTKRSLDENSYLGGLHPNLRGHATFATAILAQVLMHLNQ